MATSSKRSIRHEHCEQCDGETPHAVSIELRTEGTGGKNAVFSREPYRVAECRRCGATVSRRMNDA